MHTRVSRRGALHVRFGFFVIILGFVVLLPSLAVPDLCRFLHVTHVHVNFNVNAILMQTQV